MTTGTLALFATSMLFLDPLFFTQFWKSWLDLIQTFFLLFNTWIFMFLIKKKRNSVFFALLLGLSLGLFAETKPPVFFPILFMFQAFYFLSKYMRKSLIIFLLGIFIGVTIPYFRYFQLHHNFFDLIRLHKYLFSIYAQSKNAVHHTAIWQSLFLKRFPDIASGLPIPVDEWWIVWPIITIFGILAALLSIFRKGTQFFQKSIGGFLVASLIIYTIVPFNTRYLVVLLPFLLLLSIQMLKKLPIFPRKVIIVSFLVYGLVHSMFFLIPKPDSVINDFLYNFSHQYFQDIYQEDIANMAQTSLSREEFRSIAQKALEQATVRAIEIKERERKIPLFGKEGKVRISVIYKTQHLGSFSEEKTLRLMKKDSQWKIKWDSGIILNNFKPGYAIDTSLSLGRRGNILKDQKIFASDQDGYLISINPSKIDTRREQKMLKEIAELLTTLHPAEIQNAYLENPLPDSSIPIATTFFYLVDEKKQKLLSYPGLILTEYPSRTYTGSEGQMVTNTFYHECCTKIYSSYNYHGKSGTEEDYDKMLWGYSGGKIIYDLRILTSYRFLV